MKPGARLAHYEVLSAVGRGGMGEVWKARDTKLGREVALKTLPPEFARDAERLDRFEREARLLASLNHPNIAAIYGLEQSDDARFLVLELVEGDTLADRLGRGAIPAGESLRLAIQIAEALEAAHQKGVIHRDLKPANVKVTFDGRVKVLDFGLAKAFAGREEDGEIDTNSPTLSMQATAQGLILGTAAYMAPEQAKGRATDKRADVWAFGCVLYEMLTGQPAFEGEDVSEILASVIKAATSLDRLPANIDPGIRRVLSRCLEKDLQKRFRDIGDVRLELEQILADSGGVRVETGAADPRPGWGRLVPWIAGMLGALAAALGAWYLKPLPPQNVARVVVSAPPNAPVNLSNFYTNVAISPDGQTVAYHTPSEDVEQIYVRPVGALEGVTLDSSSRMDNPFFSPDGEWIGFGDFSGSSLKRVRVDGGPAESIAEWTGYTLRGASWGADGGIIFAAAVSGGLMEVPEVGGQPEQITTPAAGEMHLWPEILPDPGAVLFTIVSAGGEGDERRIALLDRETGEYRDLIAGGTHPRYASTGHILFGVGTTLYAVPFDAGRLEVSGDPVPVLEGVLASSTGALAFDVSEDGSLVYVPGGYLEASAAERLLAIAGRDGSEEVLPLAAALYRHPRLSPEGETIAVEIEGENRVIWTYDLSGETAIQRLAFDGNNFRPLWTPDGRHIAFASDRDGPISIYRQDADGSGVAERLTTAEEGTAHWPEAWSPDGETLVYKVERPSPTGAWNFEGNEMDLWMVRLEAPDRPEPVANEPQPVMEFGASFSPGGEWLAYTVGLRPASEDYEVWARPFPITEERRRVSQGAGVVPLWSPRGDELFYRLVTVYTGSRQTLRSVRVSTAPALTFGVEAELGIRNLLSLSYYRNFDVMPDGERFVIVRAGDPPDAEPADTSPQVVMVLNWHEELRERVPPD